MDVQVMVSGGILLVSTLLSIFILMRVTRGDNY